MRYSFYLVLFLLLSLKSFSQVYQEMPQYGYRANRMAFDSTLQIPTTCGVPTLKSVVSVNKKSAIAFDSCNNKFYSYNPKTQIWSQISGGNGTIPSLQQVVNVNDTLIDSKIILKDTSSNRNFDIVNNDDDYGFIFNNNYDSTQTYYSHSYISNWKYGIGGDMMYFPKYIGEDTFAMLRDLRNEIPSLQQVTDQGDTTTNNIYLNHDAIGWNNAISLFAKTDSGIRPKIEIASLNGYTRITPDYSYINDASNNQLQLSTGALNFNDATNYNVISPIENGYHFFRLVETDTSIHNDTIALLKDIRNSTIKSGRFGNDTATIVMAKVHNDAGVQLTNGKVVRWASSGSNSDVPSVRLANNKHDSSSANTIGFVSGTINVNDTGWVILSGKIEKLNTSAFLNGDIIYLDSTSGEWTKSKPSGPLHLVYLGVVIKANSGNGSIFVKCQNGYEMDEIHDVKITTPLNNQILVYSDTQKLWKNRNVYSVVDTTSLSSRINAKQNTISGLLTNHALETDASANIVTSAITKTELNYLNGVTSSIQTQFNSKLNISDTANMLSPYYRTSNYDNDLMKAYQSLGSTIKSIGLGCIMPANMSATLSLTSGQMRFTAIYLPKSATITGVKWYQQTAGNYTASAENRIGLYSYSGGTMTLVASTTNDGTLWSAGASATLVSKAFSSTYSASAGIYFIGITYNSSAQTTAPAIGAGPNLVSNIVDFTNSVKIGSTYTSTTLPSSLNQSSTSAQLSGWSMWLY